MVVLICFRSHLNQLLLHTFYFPKTRIMEKKKFTFMETYFETVKQLKEHDPKLADELLNAIIQYGLYGIETDNPLIKALMVQIQYAIDTGKEISQKNSENGKKGGRPKKSESQSETSETKANESEKNPKKANESEGKQKEKENKKKKENNIILSSNEDKSASTGYGNEEINECLEIIKSFNDGMIDGTQKQNRIDAKNLISKLKKIPSVENGEYTRQNTLQAVLGIISKNKYHASKITSPGSIYRHLAILFQVCKQEGINQNSTRVFTAL